ncbi:MAG: aldo/keto reductase [Erysipelotrichaceae bacterium]|nr:aldo/keto reductase [Erysipelotrichaceae bacterium]
MKYIKLYNTELEVSQIALGHMRISKLSVNEAEVLIKEALALGINFYDHADIYGGGKCEAIFGEVLKRNPGMREKMVIQSKCDIVVEAKGGKRYDTSHDYIMECVTNSIKNLNCGYLDILLIHRADALCDPKELAETFKELKEKGMVKYFGVSNHTKTRIELIQKYWKEPLVVNQMQLSIVHAPMIDFGFCVDMVEEGGINRDGELIDYCRLKDITMQVWCPLQASWADGTFIDNPKFPKLNEVLAKLADKYQVSKAAIAIAWLLRHPADFQVITGTTSIPHLKEACEALNVSLEAQEWYDLYAAEGKMIP